MKQWMNNLRNEWTYGDKTLIIMVATIITVCVIALIVGIIVITTGQATTTESNVTQIVTTQQTLRTLHFLR